MPSIKLQSSDGEIFDTDIQVAERFGIIKSLLGDCPEDDENAPVPLPKVNSTILRKVLSWAQHHKDDVEPTEDDDNKDTDEISSWDADFLKVDKSILFGIIAAANYLEIKELLELTCQAVANMIKGKTPQEIRNIFNIRDESTFTRSEEEQA
ncbi:S-phase kinase-associated protein 1-like [Drosophila gunungcola]|uniref:S-phase kinase-associated protein 1 n=1 Tax=Drosophila gunungcola TaxID=103775 RepID=A0A9Q0BRD5_9MUSC|nr:S-phase kinase-associated protein 1-like [Drosophila gunungcola]KAI8040999.1 hypothetical protein M5D96_005248 [Drosophila gunungcola]